jgi:hypothetical protein
VAIEKLPSKTKEALPASTQNSFSAFRTLKTKRRNI